MALELHQVSHAPKAHGSRAFTASGESHPALNSQLNICTPPPKVNKKRADLPLSNYPATGNLAPATTPMMSVTTPITSTNSAADKTAQKQSAKQSAHKLSPPSKNLGPPTLNHYMIVPKIDFPSHLLIFAAFSCILHANNMAVKTIYYSPHLTAYQIDQLLNEVAHLDNVRLHREAKDQRPPFRLEGAESYCYLPETSPKLAILQLKKTISEEGIDMNDVRKLTNLCGALTPRLDALHRRGRSVPRIHGAVFNYPTVANDPKYRHVTSQSSYVIIDRLNGEPLFDRNWHTFLRKNDSGNSANDYARGQIFTLANAPQKHFNGFIDDAIDIRSESITQDVHLGNYLYDRKSKMSHVDLNQINKESLTDTAFAIKHLKLALIAQHLTDVRTQRTADKFKEATADIFAKLWEAMLVNGIREQSLSRAYSDILAREANDTQSYLDYTKVAEAAERIGGRIQ